MRLLPEPGPSRVLAATTALYGLGFGFFSTGAPLYFHRMVGLSEAEVGAGVALAAAVWMLAAPFVGRLTDRIGARETCLFMSLFQALPLLVAPKVTSFGGYVAVITLIGVAERGGAVSKMAYIGQIADPEARGRLYAYNRSVVNIGLTAGVALSGLAIGRDTESAYALLFYGFAAISVAVGALMGLLPRIRVKNAARYGSSLRGNRALRDRPFVLVSLLCGLTGIGDTILTLALPLWILARTAMPPAVTAWLIALNTALVVLFQVRAGKGADTPEGAGRKLRGSSIALVFACPVIGVSAVDRSGILTVASLIAATVLLTVSELFTSTAQWGLQYGLSPRHAQGEYGAVFSIGYTVQSVIGPVALTSLMENAGTAGWLLIAVLFAVLAVATAPAVRWAIATRPKEPQDPTETGSRTAAGPACSRAATARPSAGSMCVDRPASGPADNACPTAADPAAAARRTHRQRTPITHPGAAPPPQPHQGKRSTTRGDHPT